MFYLIVSFGFLLVMRGAHPAPLQDPAEGFRRVVRETADLFLTAGLILACGAAAMAFKAIRLVAEEYTLLGYGVAAYLLSRYQKKTDVFFLCALAVVFMISSRQAGLPQEILLVLTVCVGIALFQILFLGLRYRLLFSDVPVSVRGWPVLCLLAGLLSLVLGGLESMIF